VTTALAKYDAACRAIAEAATVDEVKYFHDEAAAMGAYARMARNRELEAQCAEIRMRATRRLGEMVREQKRTIGLAKGGRPKTGLSEDPVSVPTFASQGIDKNLAKDARTLSDLPPEKFEERVAEAREAALGAVPKVIRRQAHEDRKHEREQIDANPSMYELQQKERRQGQRRRHSRAWRRTRSTDGEGATSTPFGTSAPISTPRCKWWLTGFRKLRGSDWRSDGPRADPSVGVQLRCNSGPPDNGGQCPRWKADAGLLNQTGDCTAGTLPDWRDRDFLPLEMPEHGLRENQGTIPPRDRCAGRGGEVALEKKHLGYTVLENAPLMPHPLADLAGGEGSGKRNCEDFNNAK
jgi:hypothetical protein